MVEEKTSPFVFTNSINNGQNIYDGEDVDVQELERVYSPYLTNRAFSYHLDTILYANEMNINHGVHGKAQYLYYLHTIKPRKRFGKWPKPEKNDDIALIKKVYSVNLKRAKVMLRLLNKEQLTMLRAKYDTGG